MTRRICFSICWTIVFVCSGLQAQQDEPEVLGVDSIQRLPQRIAFGSCGHQDKKQPVLRQIVKHRPDLFIYLGDNIYGDTRDMRVLQKKYDKLGAKEEFRELRKNVPVLSVWDDHDYGWNDAGKEYPFKKQSKEIFMDFWKVPKDSARRKHEGIYGSHRFRSGNRQVQVILLDTRTFRDPLKKNPRNLKPGSKFKNAYQPDSDPNKTILGKQQWAWLKKTLSEKADLRIICSSIQFGHQYNGWESWTNLPNEQKRMIDLIRSTGANGVVFISGDVHWGEISKRQYEKLYPIYDVTASGLTQDWHNVEPNKFRVGQAFRKNHFGMIEVDWKKKDPTVRMTVIDVAGKVQVQHTIALSELNFDKNSRRDNSKSTGKEIR